MSLENLGKANSFQNITQPIKLWYTTYHKGCKI